VELLRFYGARPSGRRGLYFCPLHGDEHASLSVYTHRGQHYCHCFSAHSDCPLATHRRNDAFNVYCIGAGAWRTVLLGADAATAQRYADTVSARWPMGGGEAAPNMAARIAKSHALGDSLSILLDAEAARDETLAQLAEESARIGHGLNELRKVRTIHSPAPSAPAARPNEYVIPADATPTTCRSCGAGMVFIRTPAGKALPLSVATIQERDGVRYALPHFADCPNSKEWSKK
jgi:hypothetical protein